MDKNSWVQERLAALEPGGDWRPDVNAGLGRLRRLHVREGSMSRRWMLAVIGAAAVFLCLMALPSPKVLAHKCLECTIAVLESLSPAAPVPSNLKPRSDRSLAPDFSLEDAQGSEVKLSELKGKVILVNFWATWCEGCQVEIPWFIEFQNKYKDGGLVVIGVSLDADGWKSVKPWLNEKKVNYPVVIGGEALGKQYGLEGMPLTALLDREGRIADLHSGIVDKAATQKKIRTLLREDSKHSAN